jgi:hypothetical protein
VVGRTSRHINLNVKGSKSASNWLASETNKEDILTAENCLRKLSRNRRSTKLKDSDPQD